MFCEELFLSQNSVGYSPAGEYSLEQCEASF